MELRSTSDVVVEPPEVAAGVASSAISNVCPNESQEIVGSTNENDDSKTPPIFGRLWREYVSVFTLAFAPGLNVRFNFHKSNLKSMSVGSVNIALPSIGRNLIIDNSNLTWVVAAYS